MHPIPYGRQQITEPDIEAVVEALQSDYLTQGPRIYEFEQAFASYVGVHYAVAVSNGTAALHLSALALGVSQGDKVITSPITFAASANCIRYCGGEITFADIDPKTYLIDIKSVQNLLESSPPGTYQGIVPVDFTGKAVDLQALRSLADEHGVWILEDACHAPGGYFTDSTGKDQACGNGQFADLAIFSFHPVKHIACGEGGMITTNNEQLYRKLLMLRTHGITKKVEQFVNSPMLASADSQVTTYPGWYMEMQTLGFNYRLTDFQAALGISQLARAADGLATRRKIAQRYADALTGKSFLKGHSGVVKGHAYHLYIIEVADRLGLYEYLRKNGVFSQVHYFPCHLMPYYRNLGWQEGDFPYAELYYSRCLSLPMFPTLTEEMQVYVITKVLEYYQ